MKKILAVICAALIFISFFPTSAVEALEQYKIPKGVFALPKSLQYIGEEAFDDVPGLTDVYIPARVVFIAESAFQYHPRLIIHGEENSYVQSWSEKHGYTFAADYSQIVFLLGYKISTLQADSIASGWIVILINKKNKLLSRIRKCFRSLRPQDRPELNPIDYRFP